MVFIIIIMGQSSSRHGITQQNKVVSLLSVPYNESLFGAGLSASLQRCRHC